jgi:hypothetical protein
MTRAKSAQARPFGAGIAGQDGRLRCSTPQRRSWNPGSSPPGGCQKACGWPGARRGRTRGSGHGIPKNLQDFAVNLEVWTSYDRLGWHEGTVATPASVVSPRGRPPLACRWRTFSVCCCREARLRHRSRRSTILPPQTRPGRSLPQARRRAWSQARRLRRRVPSHPRARLCSAPRAPGVIVRARPRSSSPPRRRRPAPRV